MGFIIDPDALILPIFGVKMIEIIKEIDAPYIFIRLMTVFLLLGTTDCLSEAPNEKKAAEGGVGSIRHA